jgi:hypothetical protein
MIDKRPGKDRYPMPASWPDPFTVSYHLVVPESPAGVTDMARRMMDFRTTSTDLLATLGDREWALSVDGAPAGDMVGIVDIDALVVFAGLDDYAWHQTLIRWEPPLLHVDLGPARVTLQGLTPVQQDAYAAWVYGDVAAERPRDRRAAGKVVTVAEPVLTLALAIYRAIEANDGDISFGDVLAAVQDIGVTAVTPEDLAIIAGLAPGWPSTTIELITAPEHVKRAGRR